MYKYKSNAKINLFLDVNSKLNNGYHKIKSIFFEIIFYDLIKFKKNNLNTIRYFTNNKKILPENNLVVKAGQLFRNYLKKDIKGLDFFLEKRIPIGSGLGGGSSNAASIIKILNNYYQINLKPDKLRKISKNIGADIPFFIEGGVQKVLGYGEITEKIIPYPLKLNIILVFPKINISTKTAYELIDNKGLDKETTENNKKFNALLNAIKNGNYKGIINNIYNKFEEVIFIKYPNLKYIYDNILSTNPDKVFMSGSGSTLVGLYPTNKSMKNAIKYLRKKGYKVKQVKIIY
jgi:4-diphosphocytidyl-2-C-methyl-D-erythritol kinase